MPRERDDSRSGRKICSLIEILRDHGELGVTGIADRLDVAKSTAHYHLTTLQREGYVLKEDGRYRLSLRFLGIGQTARSRVAIHDTAMGELERVAGETDELVILGVEERGLGVYLDKAPGENAIDIDASIGRFAPLHNRAFGKAILAHLGESRVGEILDEHGLPQTTSATISGADELFRELESIRSQGYAVNEEESLDGIHGVAVPLLDGDEVLGAISIAGPSRGLALDTMVDEYADILSRARNVIELNYQHNG